MTALRGDRNQCRGCLAYFNSTSAFDKHRTGEIGRDRRCLDEEGMRAKGMVLGTDGFWRGSAMPADVLSARTAPQERTTP